MQPLSRVVVVADDLTGAADTGVQFRRAGLPARVWLKARPPAPNGATVYDTDTRALPPHEAAGRLDELGATLAAVAGEPVYKKVDSTVRGNVGAETEALLLALDRRIALVAPAFPANGRTTRDGVQLVNGVPAHLTAAASDPAHPMRFLSIEDALRSQSSLPVLSLPLSLVRAGPDAIVAALAEMDRAFAIADAESDGDLALIAAAVARLGSSCLPVGSAGLAAQLPTAWHLAIAEHSGGSSEAPRKAGGDVLVPRGPSARAGGALFVCGSLNPRTLEQAGRLCAELSTSPVAAFDRDATELAAARLNAGQAVVLTSAGARDLTAAQVADHVGATTAAILRQAASGALLLTGGDTARSVLGALGAEGIELEAELLPGLPICRIHGGTHNGTPVITKAGGFGPPDALVIALRYLRGGVTPG